MSVDVDGVVEKRMVETPGEDFPVAEEPVGDCILDFISIGKQVDIVDHNRSSKSIRAVNVSIVDAGLDHMTPAAEVPLQLRANEIRAVVDRSAIQRVSQNQLRFARMRIKRLAKTHALAPRNRGRLQNWKLNRRMQIESFDEGRRCQRCVPACNSGKARVGTEVQRKSGKCSFRKRDLECGELSQYHRRLIGEKHSVPPVKYIHARLRPVAAGERQRLLQGRRDDVEPILVNLAEHERTDQIHIRGSAKVVAEVTECQNARALSTLSEAVVRKKRRNLDFRSRVWYRAEVDCAGRTPFGEVLARKRCVGT